MLKSLNDWSIAIKDKNSVAYIDYAKAFDTVCHKKTIFKMLEKLTLARLNPHIVKSPNYRRLKFAYSVRHSTETALVKLVDDVSESVDICSAVAFVSSDSLAALNAVNHTVLLD